MNIGDTTYIAMILTTDAGDVIPVWQKAEVTTVKSTTAMTVTYVDAAGVVLTLAEPYEMTVVDGEILTAPGGV